MDNIRQQMGRRIKEIRNRLDLTQAQFGEKFVPPLSPQSISGYEQGDVWPTYMALIEIAKLGGCSLDFLILGGNSLISGDLSSEESELIECFRRSNRDDQMSLLRFAKSVSALKVD